MYTKRQTVWLVSMLSLMVVLSAYYLFTEDAGTVNHNQSALSLNEVKVDSTDLSMHAAEQIVKEAAAGAATGTGTTAGSAQSGAANSSAGSVQSGAANSSAGSVQSGTANSSAGSAQSGAANSSAGSVQSGGANSSTGSAQTDAANSSASSQAATAGSDAQVIQKVAAQATSGREFFDSMQMQRTEELSKQSEKWMTIVTDSSQKTENVTKAYEELNKLQEMEARMTSIEEKLLKDFPNAIVTQDSNRFKVIVQADRLQKSQAVTIVDMMMQEMSIGPELISVQYIR